MALEPTMDQLKAVMDRLDENVSMQGDARTAVVIVWRLVRDQVLEEAERRLDALESHDAVAFMGHAVIRLCDLDKAMEAVRAMKGTS